MDAHEEGIAFMRRNIDAWWPYIERGCEAVVVTASGCGAMVKEYGYHLALELAYAAKAARIADLAKDVSEIIVGERAKLLSLLAPAASRVPPRRVAYHPPCSLQHAQKLRGDVESLLGELGVTLVPVADTHLCCGSAGSYSLFQPEISARLLKNRLAALTRNAPEEIVTANVGCQVHIQSSTPLRVRHWIELVDELLS
jgi:glycolate oxidase iron-sulfur subunit